MDAIERVEKNGYSMVIEPDLDAEDPRVMFDFWSDEDVEHWHNGEVYGYIICMGDPDIEHAPCVDSCWGFYGYDHARQSAMEQLDFFASLQPPLSEATDA